MSKQVFFYLLKGRGKSMDARKYDEVYTIEDIYALPEGERAELIDGQLYMMAAPGLDHQDILGLMFRKMSDCIESRQNESQILFNLRTWASLLAPTTERLL
jgi:Uma2 family endonuclease